MHELVFDFAEMKKGSTQFPDATRQTGEGSMVISHKASKKLKTTMGPVAGIDKANCSKRVKLPKKPLEDNHPVLNLESVPRKLRSVIQKRHSESSSSPSTDSNKKVKLNQHEQQHSIIENEEVAIAGLLALAGHNKTLEINLNNEVSEATASKPKDLVQKLQIHDLNESRNKVDLKKEFKDLSAGSKLRNRCCSHVYICQMIKKQQDSKGKMVNSHQESKAQTTTENLMNVNTGINLNETIPFNNPADQPSGSADQPSGCGSESYFGNPFCDPSQWSRPMFPTQKMWMTPLMYKPPQPGSYIQSSMHNVLGYKQQLPFKMQLDNKNGLPTLKLALQ